MTTPPVGVGYQAGRYATLPGFSMARSFICMLVLVALLGTTAVEAAAKGLKIGVVNVSWSSPAQEGKSA